MLKSNVECRCWMSNVSMPDKDDLGQGPACSSSAMAHACSGLGSGLALDHACSGLGSGSGSASEEAAIILTGHADIRHSTLTLNVSPCQGGSVSSWVSPFRVRSDPCRSVSSRIRVKPRPYRAVSSRPRVHGRRVLSCQTAACPRVRAMSAPP